jgi:hypothetical protein
VGVTVLIGLFVYAIYPTTDRSFVVGLELEPQNISENMAGFIAALFAFRAVTTKNDKADS